MPEKMIRSDEEFGKPDEAYGPEPDPLRAAAADVRRLAAKVARSFRRRGAPGDQEDWEQDAALAIVEGVRSRGKPVQAEGWHFVAARREVGLAMSRALAIVHLSEHAAVRARRYQNRTPIVGCGYGPAEDGDARQAVDLEGRSASPLAALDAAERAMDRRRLGYRIAGHLAAMAERDRRLLGPVLGAGGDDPVEPEEAAWTSGVPIHVFAGAVRRLGERVRRDPRARRLRARVIEGA